MKVPVEHQLRISIIEELHVVDKIIHVVFIDIGQVGLRHDEKWERHLVPLGTSCKVEVHTSPRVEPNTLAHANLCEVVGVIAAEAFKSRGVGDAINRSFLVHQDTSLLRIDVGDTGLILECHRKIRCVEEVSIEIGQVFPTFGTPRCDSIGQTWG